MKRIFTICVLFILLSVPTQAQGTLIYLPLIFKSVGCEMPFPTTGILDDFNRANEGPPPSASWTVIVGPEGLVVESNQLRDDPAGVGGGTAYWNTAYGPNIEGFFTVPTRPADGSYVEIAWLDSGASDGYSLTVTRNDATNDTVSIIRYDASAPTTVSGPYNVTFADGDSFGIGISGDTISAYQKTGGSWGAVGSTDDTTYRGTRYLFIVITDATTRLDDFGGGNYVSSDGVASMNVPYCNTMNNNWSFIQPVESTNYVLNPSAEAASNYSSLGGATITRSSTYQKYGRYSYRVQTGTNGQGLSLTLSTLTNSVHFVTTRIRGALPINTRFIIGTGLKTPVFIEKIDDDWYLYGVQFNASETNGRTELRIIQQGNGVGDFYVDGVQVEPLAYWTTYIDGTQEGCAWNGIEHASTSTRSGLSLAGGQVKDFYDDYGFLVEKVIGAGSPPQNVNIDEYAILPGGELNSIKVLPRDMSIVGKFIADNELELHDKQQALHLALSSENYPNNQSFKLRFNGARVQKEIEVNYKGGLEGDLNAFYQDRVVSGDSDWELLYKWIEKASIQFQAPDPYWYETGESAANLDGNDSATFRIVAGRLKSTGQWSELGPPNAAGTYTDVRTIAEDATYIYFGGDFLNFDNIANADYIVRYHKSTGVYSAMGTGGDNTVEVIVIAPNGDVYAGGAFNSMGGVAGTAKIAVWRNGAWESVGGGANSSVYSMAFASNGLLYVGGGFSVIGATVVTGFASWNGISFSSVGGNTNGDVYAVVYDPGNNLIYIGGIFTTVAGGTSANYVARYNISSSAWSALGSGMDSTVQVLLVTPTGNLIAGGNFTTAGGGSASRIAEWNRANWSPLGSGVSDQVLSLAYGDDNVLYAGGLFTSAGGITLGDRVARWNGYAWAHMDIDLPGSSGVYAFMLGKSDAVVKQKYDIYIGFITTGTGYFAGKVAVINDGNALVFPQIIFKRTGGTVITIETLKNETTGKELLFDYDLLDNERLTIDLTPTKKSIISNYFGSRLDAMLANSDFGVWTLKPGSNDITCFTADNFALYPSSLDAYLLWRDKYKSYN